MCCDVRSCRNAIDVKSQWSMEQRLAEFRARKAKSHPQDGESGEQKTKTFIQTARERLHRVFSRSERLEPAETQISDGTQTSDTGTEGMPMMAEDASQCDVEPTASSLGKAVLLVKFLLWLVLLGLFVELEFGLVYFILSMFYWLYEGTRRPGLRKRGEKSAYSVFNPGCEAIQGTLTAEQFERELQYRPLAGYRPPLRSTSVGAVSWATSAVLTSCLLYNLPLTGSLDRLLLSPALLRCCRRSSSIERPG
ncbi:SAYSvFN domain-containing protein 1 isoform X3 [Phyllobates terribilis]|uniref:SAYSvFN domain-containing protein 1 isoform X3 n=1 Tax=Phyllobates terribilis TaxID=111132 RepID=UPI003CCAE9ED